MVANLAPIFILSANIVEHALVNADSTTPQDLIAAGSDGSKVLAINCTSDDTGSRIVQVFMHDGSTAFLIGSTLVATLAGTDGVEAGVNLLDSVAGTDADGELFIPSGYKIQVGVTVAVTAAKTISLVALGGDY